MSEPFPADVLQEIETMAPGVIPDFGSVDFLGEPWAWILLVARDMPERSQYLRESGAPGPYMVDFREAFQHHWGTDASAKLMRVLVSLVEGHFSMVAQGLHRRKGYYATRMRSFVREARTILDPLFVAYLPEEHRKAFLAARLVETTTAVPASARTCALAIMRVRPPQAVRPEKPAPDVAAPTATAVTAGGDQRTTTTTTTTATGNRLGSKERKRQEAARTRLLASQYLAVAAARPTAGRDTRDSVPSLDRPPTNSPPPSRPPSKTPSQEKPQPRVEDLSLVPPAVKPAVPRAQKAAEVKQARARAAAEKAARKASLARRSRSHSGKAMRGTSFRRK